MSSKSSYYNIFDNTGAEAKLISIGILLINEYVSSHFSIWAYCTCFNCCRYAEWFRRQRRLYDKLGMNTSNYREIIPKLKDLIEFCRSKEIDVFYTEAVKEASGIDVLTRIHNILPKSRQERLKFPICIRGTWDGVTIDELKPKENDPVVIKRRDSAFQDTELRIWLQSQGVNLLVFAGIDTSICVETSLREGFNIGYDVALISDATASGYEDHYKTTLDRVRDYYGLVMSVERFKKAIDTLDKIRKGEINLRNFDGEKLDAFLEEFDLLDPRTFALSREASSPLTSQAER